MERAMNRAVGAVVFLHVFALHTQPADEVVAAWTIPGLGGNEDVQRRTVDHFAGGIKLDTHLADEAANMPPHEQPGVPAAAFPLPQGVH